MLIPDHELAINIHQQIVANGFCTVINWDLFDPIRQDPRFIEVANKSLQLKAKLQQQASLQCQVFTPDNLNPNSPTPLFIALHGDSNDTTTFKKHWQAQYMLAKGFIVVYEASGQVVLSMFKYLTQLNQTPSLENTPVV